MATYHFDVKSLSRKDNQSVRAHVMYISRACQYARGRPGHDRDRCLWVESVNIPAWGVESEGERAEADHRCARRFWLACQSFSRSNARLAVKITLAMPVELSINQQLELARAYVAQATTLRDGHSVLAATWALHEGKGTNPHLHVCLAETVVDEHPRSAETWFARAANKGLPPESGGARRTREIHGEWVAEQRKAWEALANLALERAGVEARIDSRSLADRGSEDVPQEHVGWGPQAAVRRQRNAQRRSLSDRVRELRAERDSIIVQIGTTHAATAATTETPDARAEQRPNDRPETLGLRAPDCDAGRHVAEPIPGLANSAAINPCQQSTAVVLDLADARPAGGQRAADERADAQPRAAAFARFAAPTRDVGLQHLRRGRLDGGAGAGRAKLLQGAARRDLGRGGNKPFHGLLGPRDGGRNLNEVAEVTWRLITPAVLPKREDEVVEIGRAQEELRLRDLLAALVVRIVEWILRLLGLAEAAAQVAADRARALGYVPHLSKTQPCEAPRLSTTPGLAQLPRLSQAPRLMATNRRPVTELSDRSLAEQLTFAMRGEASHRELWLAAINARDDELAKHYRMQHTARRARIEALEAEIACRAAMAVATPEPTPVDTASPVPKAIDQNVMDITTEALRKMAQISLSAMTQAACLVGAGGLDAAAAAVRLRTLLARRRAILKELADLEVREASACAETPAQEPVAAAAGLRDRTEMQQRAERLAAATDMSETAARDVKLREAIALAWLDVDRAKASRAAASGWRQRAERRMADQAREAALNTVRAAAESAAVAGLPDTHDRKCNAQALDVAREHAKVTECDRKHCAQQVADLRRAQKQAEDARRLVAASAWLAGRTAEDVAKAKAKAEADAAASAERQRLAAQQQALHPAQPTTPQPPRRHYPIPGVRRRD